MNIASIDNSEMSPSKKSPTKCVRYGKRLTMLLGDNEDFYDDKQHEKLKQNFRKSSVFDIKTIPTQFLQKEFFNYKQDDPSLSKKAGYFKALDVLKSKEPKQRSVDDIKQMRKYID